MALLYRLRPSAVPCIRNVRYFTTSPQFTQSLPPIPYTSTCPSPTCACAPAPPDLDIDRKSPLMNTVASYAEQVVVCTGKDDWSSRIEDEEGRGGDFVRGLKGVIGKGGEGFDPFNNVLVTASSLPTTTPPQNDSYKTTALLFPSFKRLPALPHTCSTFSNLATAYLKARSLNPFHDGLSPEQKSALTRNESASAHLPPAEEITTPTILICGHGGRDKRCGILGPLLRMQFQTEFSRRNIPAEVGLISHIGGHKFAGNVIMYIPPSMQNNALRGCGVWYGRVGPENVEGLVEETVVGGKIVKELFRGGVRQGGGDLGRELEAQIQRDGGGDEQALKLKPTRARASA